MLQRYDVTQSNITIRYITSTWLIISKLFKAERLTVYSYNTLITSLLSSVCYRFEYYNIML